MVDKDWVHFLPVVWCTAVSQQGVGNQGVWVGVLNVASPKIQWTNCYPTVANFRVDTLTLQDHCSLH